MHYTVQYAPSGEKTPSPYGGRWQPAGLTDEGSLLLKQLFTLL